MSQNIKAKIDLHWSGEEKPFTSVEDYETLEGFMLDSSEPPIYEKEVKSIFYGGKTYKVENVKIGIDPSPNEDPINRAIDSVLVGPPMSYNFRISIFIKRQ
ncbi:MAG: hypothetical protein MJA30_11310 [Cytophagales bacterium]|nr:hypothetical protein [Cytophagales bacterium]